MKLLRQLLRKPVLPTDVRNPVYVLMDIIMINLIRSHFGFKSVGCRTQGAVVVGCLLSKAFLSRSPRASCCNGAGDEGHEGGGEELVRHRRGLGRGVQAEEDSGHSLAGQPRGACGEGVRSRARASSPSRLLAKEGST